MKILTSDMTFLSEHQFEQMDASVKEIHLSRRRLQNRRSLAETGDIEQLMADRVSFSHNQNIEYQSNYSATMSGNSLVNFSGPSTLKGEETISHEQQYTMEKLIGGVIDGDVVITRMQKGEDIVLENGDVIQTDGQARRPVDMMFSRTLGRSVGMVSGSQAWEMSLKQTDIHFEEESLFVSSQGSVVTEDGRTIDFSLDMALDRSFVSRTENQTLLQQQINMVDPLVVSLDGKAPQLSDVWFEFDLDSDGETEQVNFVNPGSGFLAFDKNSDQVVNDGSELFGPGTGNGFEELAAFDEDQNRWIDENDAVFSQLSVWMRDENGNDQLISLKDTGIGAIALDYASSQFQMTEMDNSLQGRLRSSGVFLFENGNVGSVHQIDLASRPREPLDEKETLAIEAQPSFDPVNALSGGIIESAKVQEDQPEEKNPLKELLQRIDELKERMGRLYEKMNFTTPHNRHRRNHARDYQAQILKDPMLFPGYESRPIRFRNWSV